MTTTKSTGKAIKATTRTRQVPEDQVPAELRNMYDGGKNADEVSLDFDANEANDEPEERDELFRSKGVSYTIPVEFGPGIGLLYLNRIDEGRDVALGYILKTVIGKAGWAALMELAEANRITAPQMKAILKKVNDRTMGAVEDIEGN